MLRRSTLLLIPAVLLSCARDNTAPTELGIQAGKGGGGGGGGLSVTSTNPRSAPRDTTLQVRVFGSGFDAGSRVSFARRGVTTTAVTALTTSFVSSTELLSTVQVSAQADTIAYDVVVLTSTGKKGIGSELFLIEGDPSATWMWPLQSTGLSVSGDEKEIRDGWSVYAHGKCGVNAKIFATDAASNSGDAIMHTNNTAYKDRKCVNYPRKVRITYPDGVQEVSPVFAFLGAIQNTVTSIPIGTTELRPFNLAAGTRCGALRFRTYQRTGEFIDGREVRVTRVNSFTWDVETQPYPDNRGWCENTGEVMNMTIRFRVEAAWGLP